MCLVYRLAGAGEDPGDARRARGTFSKMAWRAFWGRNLRVLNISELHGLELVGVAQVVGVLAEDVERFESNMRLLTVVSMWKTLTFSSMSLPTLTMSRFSSERLGSM